MYFFCLMAALLTQAPASKETRWHWTVQTSRARGIFQVTEIAHLSEADDRSVFLIRTPTGGRFMGTDESNYATQTYDGEIRDAEGTDFLRMRIKFASKAKTRKESLEERRASHKVLDSPVPFEISG